MLKISTPTKKSAPPTESDQQILDELVELMLADLHHQSAPVKQRGQHPKAHGCLYGEFVVEASTLESLQQTYPDLGVGLLAQAKTYPTWIRFSSLRQTNDAKGDVHGMAMKLMSVEGDQLTESTAQTQDFTLIDVPVFFAADRVAYRDLFRAIASLKQFVRMKKEGLSLPHFVQRLGILGKTLHQFRQFLMPSPCPYHWRFRSVGILVKNLWQKKRHKVRSLLDQAFWSPAPMAWGDQKRPVKIMVKPWVMNAVDRVQFGPNYLSEQIRDRLTVQRKSACFDVFLQVANHPVPDDPTVEWPDASVVKIATLKIPPQVFDQADQKAFSEQLSFSPWHGLKVHEPIGDMNLIRRAVYQRAAELRSQSNSATLTQFGFKAGEEPTPDSFAPALLEPKPPTEQRGLTLLMPINPQALEVLKDELERFNQGEGFKRSPLTHFARFVVFDDPEIEIPPQLLFSSNYDGELEPYLEELRSQLGSDLDGILQHCLTYRPQACLNLVSFRQFVLDHDLPIQAFYVGCRGFSAQDIKNSRELRQILQQKAENNGLKTEILTLQALTPAFIPPAPPSQKLARLVRIARALGQKVWGLIGVQPSQNDPAEREAYSPWAEERMQHCEQSEDRSNRVQNQLSTLSVIKSDFHLFMLRRVLALVNTVGKLGRGKLSGIASIHFARWVIIEKGKIDPHRAFLFFESNYGDTWDNYLDDFVYLTLMSMNSIWANLVKYPTNGCQDVERFKRHSKSRQFPAQVYYSAYPDLTVLNILSDRRLAQAVGTLGQFIQGRYCDLQAFAEHPITNLVKRINRME